MKKVFLPIAVGVALLAVSCSPSKEDTKAEFVKKCTTEAYKGANTDEQKKMMDDYCACAADKLLDKFSTKELADMEKPEKAAEMQEKMMPVIEPCIQELTTKLMGTQQMEMAPAADSTATAPVE